MRSAEYLMIALAWTLAIQLSFAQTEETLQQSYLDTYVKLHDSEVLEKNGDIAGALKSMEACYDGFSGIQKSNPDWETALVGHRMDDCKVKILSLQKELGAQPQPPDAGHVTPANTSPPDFVFKTAGPAQKVKLIYPWKMGILTTMFYIGEGSNDASAWNADWVANNHGNDDPTKRNGFASSIHASTINPFYVALPFNDLAHHDKARKWVPPSWQRPDKNGRPVSACKDRWIEIKTADGTGHSCYAQWEDVGPNGNDHAEYVFGSETPAPDHAGLDVSPAVAEYLGLGDEPQPPRTRWRFVDPEDVPPGQWLKLDEQAVIYTALHQGKDSDASASPDAKK